jgi:hypothetical protein
MKLIHKVEECAVYESNKHSYVSLSSLNPPIKTFLLKLSSSGNPETATALLSNIAKSVKPVYAHTSTSIKCKALQAIPLKMFIEDMHSESELRDMAYTLTLKLLADIGTQLEQLRAEHDLIIPFLSLEDIIVIQTTRGQKECDNKECDNKEGDNKEGDNKEGDNKEGDNKEGDNKEGDNKEGDKQEDDEQKECANSGGAFDYTFIFVNAEKLMRQQQQQQRESSKSDKKELVVDVPLKVNKHTSFLPVELPESALKRLPMRLTTTSWCYSLSALCIYALLQHKFKNGEDDIERVGRPFLHTSLYFCLKRCLKSDPEERVLLYI